MQSRRKFIKNAGIFSAGLLALQTEAFGFNSDTFQLPLNLQVKPLKPLSYALKSKSPILNWLGYLKTVFQIH
jgi:hypothetical protein